MRAILHADRNWGIGKDNGLMFSLPADMKFFRETTKGKTVVMGLHTLQSLPGGKPLKNRTNIVLTSKNIAGDVLCAHNLDELFRMLSRYAEEDVYVIGGAGVYRALFPYCTKVYVTKVDADGGADVFVPDLDADENFRLTAESAPLTDGGYTIRFCEYENLAVKGIGSESARE